MFVSPFRRLVECGKTIDIRRDGSSEVEWVERYVVESYEPQVGKKRRTRGLGAGPEDTTRERKGPRRLH